MAVKTFKAIYKSVDKVSNVFSAICAVTCLINMVLLFLNIVMRYVFKTSLPGSTEYATVILMFVAYFGIAYTHKMRRHMQMGALYEKFSPRMKSVADVLICVVILFVFAVLAYTGWTSFEKSVRTMEVMQASVPVYRWPGRLAIVLGSLMMFVRTVFELIENIHAVIKPATQEENQIEVNG